MLSQPYLSAFQPLSKKASVEIVVQTFGIMPQNTYFCDSFIKYYFE